MYVSGFPLWDYRCSVLIGVKAVRRLLSSTIISTPSRHLLMSLVRTGVEGSDKVWEANLPVSGDWRTVGVEDEPLWFSAWKLKSQKWLPNMSENYRGIVSLSFFPYMQTKGKRYLSYCDIFANPAVLSHWAIKVAGVESLLGETEGGSQLEKVPCLVGSWSHGRRLCRD